MTREYAEQVRERVEALAGDGCHAEIREVLKNNGARLTGIMAIRDGKGTAPTVYMEAVGDSNPDEAARTVMSMIENAENNDHAEELAEKTMAILQDREEVLARVLPKLINYGWNTAMLEGMPHRKILDLAVTYAVPLGDGASVTLTNANAEASGVTERELYEAAFRNADCAGYHLEPVENVLRRCLGIKEFEEADVSLTVASNREMCHGAYAMLSKMALAGIANDAEDDLIIIPSSVHEVIVAPAGMFGESKDIAGLVAAVNTCEMDRQEVLSDSVYLYSRENGEVSIAEQPDLERKWT